LRPGLNGEKLDVIDSYTYLSITFKYNGSFVDARKRLAEQAQKSSTKKSETKIYQ
jgi:hypothetical protein